MAKYLLLILVLTLFACDQTVFGQSPDGMGYKAAATASFSPVQIFLPAASVLYKMATPPIAPPLF